MKKGILIFTSSVLFTLSSHAQSAPATVITAADKAAFGYITAATKDAITFKTSLKASKAFTLSRAKQVKGIVFSEPKAFSQGLENYLSGDYVAALESFTQVSTDQKSVKSLPGNYGSIADLYIAECHRQSGDLEMLKKAVINLRKSSYTNPFHVQQLELYDVWEAASEKAWGRVLTVANNFDKSAINDEQKAQLAYLSGLAFENQKKPEQAIASYNQVLSVNVLGNQTLTGQAILRALGLYGQDAQVKAAMKAIDAKKESGGRPLQKLYQAASLSSIYQNVLKDAPTLPTDLAALSKYAYKAEAK